MAYVRTQSEHSLETILEEPDDTSTNYNIEPDSASTNNLIMAKENKIRNDAAEARAALQKILDDRLIRRPCEKETIAPNVNELSMSPKETIEIQTPHTTIRCGNMEPTLQLNENITIEEDLTSCTVQTVVHASTSCDGNNAGSYKDETLTTAISDAGLEAGDQVTGLCLDEEVVCHLSDSYNNSRILTNQNEESIEINEEMLDALFRENTGNKQDDEAVKKLPNLVQKSPEKDTATNEAETKYQKSPVKSHPHKKGVNNYKNDDKNKVKTSRNEDNMCEAFGMNNDAGVLEIERMFCDPKTINQMLKIDQMMESAHMKEYALGIEEMIEENIKAIGVEIVKEPEDLINSREINLNLCYSKIQPATKTDDHLPNGDSGSLKLASQGTTNKEINEFVESANKNMDRIMERSKEQLWSTTVDATMKILDKELDGNATVKRGKCVPDEIPTKSPAKSRQTLHNQRIKQTAGKHVVTADSRAAAVDQTNNQGYNSTNTTARGYKLKPRKTTMKRKEVCKVKETQNKTVSEKTVSSSQMKKKDVANMKANKKLISGVKENLESSNTITSPADKEKEDKRNQKKRPRIPVFKRKDLTKVTATDVVKVKEIPHAESPEEKESLPTSHLINLNADISGEGNAATCEDKPKDLVDMESGTKPLVDLFESFIPPVRNTRNVATKKMSCGEVSKHCGDVMLMQDHAAPTTNSHIKQDSYRETRYAKNGNKNVVRNEEELIEYIKQLKPVKDIPEMRADCVGDTSDSSDMYKCNTLKKIDNGKLPNSEIQSYCSDETNSMEQADALELISKPMVGSTKELQINSSFCSTIYKLSRDIAECIPRQMCGIIDSGERCETREISLPLVDETLKTVGGCEKECDTKWKWNTSLEDQFQGSGENNNSPKCSKIAENTSYDYGNLNNYCTDNCILDTIAADTFKKQPSLETDYADTNNLEYSPQTRRDLELPELDDYLANNYQRDNLEKYRDEVNLKKGNNLDRKVAWCKLEGITLNNYSSSLPTIHDEDSIPHSSLRKNKSNSDSYGVEIPPLISDSLYYQQGDSPTPGALLRREIETISEDLYVAQKNSSYIIGTNEQIPRETYSPRPGNIMISRSLYNRCKGVDERLDQLELLAKTELDNWRVEAAAEDAEMDSDWLRDKVFMFISGVVVVGCSLYGNIAA